MITQQYPWPPSARLVHSARDYLLLDMPTLMPSTVNRVCVLWDVDADARIISCLASLVYRDIRTCSHVVAFAESRGVVTCWLGSTPIPDAHLIISNAVDAAIGMTRDKWKVAPLKFIETHNGKALRPAIERDEQLRIIGERFQLGLT
jgi:hypothetical protein